MKTYTPTHNKKGSTLPLLLLNFRKKAKLTQLYTLYYDIFAYDISALC